MSKDPEQLDLFDDTAAADEPEQDDPQAPEQPPDLSLSKSEMLLLVSLADTGRDLLRRQLVMNTVPAKHVKTAKRMLHRADTLLNKIGDTHGTAGGGSKH